MTTRPSSPLPARALSLHQPWASLFALGEKDFETRSWQTRWRGVVYCHASRAKPNAEAMRNPAIVAALARHGYHGAASLPTGCILASAELTGCAVIHQATGAYVGPETRILDLPAGRHIVSATEKAFGDYRPGRFAWHFRGRRQLFAPVDVGGRQGLWIPDPATIELVEADPGYPPPLASPGHLAAAGATR